MDLTKEYPRSVSAKWQGIVQLGRAIDKAKAKAHGNVGEYNYDCPMDEAVFEFLGLDGAQLLEVVRNAKGDAEIEAYTRPFVAKKSARRSSSGISSGSAASRRARASNTSRPCATRSIPRGPIS